mgnify:CR=1 FL=1
MVLLLNLLFIVAFSNDEIFDLDDESDEVFLIEDTNNKIYHSCFSDIWLFALLFFF